ncbi:MAG: hypothetical protein ACXVQ6_12090 [Actinomycetota bacterium]
MILLLALAWAVVLIPSFVRPRFQSSPIDGVRNFERSMGVLESTRRGRQQIPGRWVMVPKDLPQAPKRRRNRLIKRRRQNFLRLIGAVFGTAILAAIPGLHFFLWLNLVADAALALYVLQLRRWHTSEQKVVPLPTARAQDTKALREQLEQDARDAGISG